jgi:hypothetical protein
MEEMIGDIESCEVIVDYILVWGKDDDEHDRRLVQVLERARKVNLKLRQEKHHTSIFSPEYITPTQQIS